MEPSSNRPPRRGPICFLFAVPCHLVCIVIGWSPLIGCFADRLVDRGSPLLGDSGQVGGVLSDLSLGMEKLSMASVSPDHSWPV